MKKLDSSLNSRFWEVDFLRGIAIVLMVLYHFFWNLNFFGFVSVNLFTGFPRMWQATTVFLFLFVVGVSLFLSYKKKRGFAKHFLFRGAKIFGYGMIITLVSFFLFPEHLIYFGILHSIGFSIILSIFFVSSKWLSLIFVPFFFFLPKIVVLPDFFNPFLLWTGLTKPLPALDYQPIFPLFSYVLLGIFVGHSLYSTQDFRNKLKNKNFFGKNFLVFFGRNSLKIYLLHQLILFPLVFLASLFFL